MVKDEYEMLLEGKVPEAGAAKADKETPGSPAAEPDEPGPPAAKPAKKKAPELDELIDAATTGRVASGAPKGGGDRAASGEKLPKKLERPQVAAGMRRARGAVRSCGRRFKTKGIVMVRVTIDGRLGRVARARAVQGHAGTPVGSCVAGAVELNARFQRFSGPPLTLNYPYVLR